MISAQQYTQVTELGKRVQNWEERISPILHREVSICPYPKQRPLVPNCNSALLCLLFTCTMLCNFPLADDGDALVFPNLSFHLSQGIHIISAKTASDFIQTNFVKILLFSLFYKQFMYKAYCLVCFVHYRERRKMSGTAECLVQRCSLKQRYTIPLSKIKTHQANVSRELPHPALWR